MASPKDIDIGNGFTAVEVVNKPIVELLTNSGGDKTRIRVDVGETSFFLGREFRTFKELNLSAGNKYLIKVVTGVNTVLRSGELSVDSGGVKMTTWLGGTPQPPGVTFPESLPRIPKNSMTEVPVPAYTSATTITATAQAANVGLTPAAIPDPQRDCTRCVSGGGQSATVSVTGATEDADRGVPGGATFYFLLETLGAGAATGVFKFHWEERP